MAQFYSIEPRHLLKGSHIKYEQVEYDINTLIRDQAELCVDVDDDCSDDEWDVAVSDKAKEIYEQLIKNGVWKNEYGQPIFLYC